MALTFGLLVAGPTLWVRYEMSRHREERTDFPGTGGELARHLLDKQQLSTVAVELTDSDDHYDAVDKAVRLSKGNHGGRSVTAVAVAAHEVGHAIQDRDGYKPLALRHRLVRTAGLLDKLGSALLLGLSIVGGAVVSPRLVILGVIATVIMGLARVAAHAITLPVEFDASFKRALPMLTQGRYLSTNDQPGARAVLRAAALTYVAGSLVQIFNLFRILRVLR